jgi:redox-sensitive bicupin YhaK (pirin superfamily)
VLDGSLTIGGRAVREGQVAWSDPAGGGSSSLRVESTTRDALARVLFYSGQPLREPVAMGGPFVMNSRAEIEAAYRDYHAGKFGQVPKQARLKRA